MTLTDLLALHACLHATEAQVNESLRFMVRPDVTVDQLARWVEKYLEAPLDLVVRLEATVAGFGGFFEEATTDHSELAASLVVAREKIEAALKKAREKPKKARKARPGDPAQGAMFERDEDDPANGVGTGDPG